MVDRPVSGYKNIGVLILSAGKMLNQAGSGNSFPLAIV